MVALIGLVWWLMLVCFVFLELWFGCLLLFVLLWLLLSGWVFRGLFVGDCFGCLVAYLLGDNGFVGI